MKNEPEKSRIISSRAVPVAASKTFTYATRLATAWKAGIMEINPHLSLAVSVLAFMVKNLVRPRGLDRLGLPCLLTGTGKAFPWSAICEVSLASSNIVEDMQLGLDLAMAGLGLVFCSNAKVTGLLPQQKHAAKSQRTRWEHVHLQTLLTQVPQLLRASVRQKRFDLVAIALDLCVPPLSLVVMIWAAAMGSTISWGVGSFVDSNRFFSNRRATPNDFNYWSLDQIWS